MALYPKVVAPVVVKATSLPIHPVCRILPPLDSEKYAALKKSISKDGCRVSVFTWTDHDGKVWVIDGAHRVTICDELGIAYKTEEYVGSGEEAIAFAYSVNLDRRQMSFLQRNNAASELEKLFAAAAKVREKAGKKVAVSTESKRDTLAQECARVGDGESKGKSLEHAAALNNVSTRSVEQFKTVQTHGTEELKAAVAEEKVSISDAATIAKAPAPVQVAAVEAVRNGKHKTVTSAALCKDVLKEALTALGGLVRRIDTLSNVAKIRLHLTEVDELIKTSTVKEKS